MRRRERRGRLLLFLVGGVLAVVAVLGYFNAKPIHLGTDDDTVEGAPLLAAETSDVLVIVWNDGIAHSGESQVFDDIDWSWVWVESLASELGPVRVAEPEELRTELGRPTRFIIVTHSAALHPEMDNQVEPLERFVSAGGTLVLERPEGALRTTFSSDGRGGMRTPTAISSATGVGQDVVTALTELPLYTRFVGSAGPLTGAETLMSIDGAPVIYRIRRGGGSAVTVDFNYGLAIVSLQQGRPNGDDLEMNPAEGQETPTTRDLVWDDFLAEAEVPYADLLEYFVVFKAIGAEAPLVGFWYYPEGADGVVVMSHDVLVNSKRALWMADWELSNDANSTFFLGNGAGLSEEDVIRYASREVGFGALWELTDQDLTGNQIQIGLGGIRPFTRRLSLGELREALQQGPSDRLPIRGVRTLHGQWTEHYTEAFEVMAAAGFQFDSSYGLAREGGRTLPAYPHGTGRPFRVHARNGLPLDLMELPIIVNEPSETDQVDRLQQFLRRSQRAHHQAFGVHFAGSLFDQEYALETFDAWQTLVNVVPRTGHMLFSPDDYVAFEQGRRGFGLTTTPLEGESVTRLAIEVQTDTEGVWLRVPATVDGRGFRGASQLGTSDSASTELAQRTVRVFGVEEVLIELPSGDHRIEVEFR